MAVERINPKTLYDPTPFGFSHASRQPQGEVIHLAGQVAWDKDLKVVGSDIATQARCALANIKTILAEVGAGPADIIRVRTYVVNHDPSKLEPVTKEMMEFTRARRRRRIPGSAFKRWRCRIFSLRSR